MRISYMVCNTRTKKLQKLRPRESFKFDNCYYIKTNSEIIPEKPGEDHIINCVCLASGSLVSIKATEEVTPIEIEVIIPYR